MTTHPPGWDRDRAVRAAAEAIERKLLTEPPDGCMIWLEADEQLGRVALEAAEAVWPHDPPRRDPRSTTSGATVLVAPPREHHAGELPPRGWPQDTQGAQPFGFTTSREM